MEILRRRSRKAGTFTLLIMGLIFTVAGGAMSFFLGSDITLTCQRSADSCVLDSTGWSGEKKELQRFPLSQLKGAEVDSKEGTSSGKSKKKTTTYQVVLRTKDGTIPFANVWSSDREAHQANADAVNRYLRSTEETLSVTHSGKTIRMIGYLFFGVGLLMFLGGVWGIIKLLLMLGFVVAKG